MVVIESADAPEIIELKHSSGRSVVTVSTHGATILSWKLFNNDLLFLSKNAILDGSRPIRGGVPIVFPQFGDNGPVEQKHGFARNIRWIYDGSTSEEESGDITGVFKLQWSEETYAMWPYKFEIIYAITVGFTNVRCQVKINNLDDKPIDFNFLFHTYFHTDDIDKTSVTGLQDLTYTDQIGDKATQSDRNKVVAFPAEVDRIYNRKIHDKKANRSRSEELLAVSDGGNADITLRGACLDDVVVWNPGPEKAATLDDLHEDGYKNFVCVEIGNVLNKIHVEPGAAFECGQHFILRILSAGTTENRRKEAKKALEAFPERKVNKILPSKSAERK